MNRGVRFVFSVHRVVGTIIALFFLMWFLTGLVLIYHPYPRLSDEQIYAHQEVLPDLLPDVDSIAQRAGGTLRKLHLYQAQGQTLAEVTTKDTSCTMVADGTQPVKPVTYATAEQIAKRWIDAPILRVDTLHERAQWVLYSRYDKVLPIYRFYFDDSDRSELFISGKNGEAQQLTTRSSRFWAWVGAIPHKFYVPALRTRLDLWMNTVAVGGALCFFAALCGLLVSL